MKILQILPELNIGGVERGTVDLAGELIRRNHQAFVVSNGGGLVKDLEQLGAKHFNLPVHKKSLFTILACVPQLVKILHEEKIDIVHARSRVPGLIAFLACRQTGVNFVTTAHGYYNQGFFSRVMGWGKRVIVSSSAIARHMVEDFDVPPERIKLIPRGVDLASFKLIPKAPITQRKHQAFIIGVVGRLSPIKGHKYFLEALARVARTLPRVKGLIVGDGKENYKEELKMLVRRLSLDKYVEFSGRVNDVAQVYKQLDLLVLPTVTQEAFGRVLIEAGASGIPVIATKVGGVVDIIEDGTNGILVAPGDSDDLARAMLNIFEQPKLTEKIILQGRKKVEQQFSLRKMAEKTIAVYEEVQGSLRILVLKISALGDVILAIPSLRALRERFPHAEISVLVARDFKPILQNCPYINHILEFPSEKLKVSELWQITKGLRRADFNIVVDLQNNRKSHLLAYLSAGNRRYGYNNGKLSFLLNHKAKEAKAAISPVEHQARTLRLLGIETVSQDLELWPEEKDRIWAEDFLKSQQKDKTLPLVGLNLQASPEWGSKNWPIENFAELINRLRQSGMQVVITGKGQQQYLAEKLAALASGNFINAVGQTEILQLASLIKRCDVYITGDSAPLHVAYAMQTPVVALFGPTDPRRHTLSSNNQAVIRKDVSCSPCYKRNCQQHKCMKEISVEEVFEAVKALLR
ncbi:lipopolysaccharide heptosyltransferase II [Candidatus Omnitrophota bacterium]